MTHDGIAAGEARLALIPEASVLRTPAAVDGDGGGSEMQPVEGGRAGGPPPAPSSGFAHLSPAECSAHLSPAAPGGGGLTFDQALTQYVGDFGRGQILNFVLASLAWVPNAMLILMLVFSSGSPVKDHDWKCTDAADAACAAALAAADPAAAGFCALGRGQWAWTRPQHTLIAQFDLVCKDAWKAQTANSFFFLGYLIGSGVFGQLADRFGRKVCLFTAAAISAVFPAISLACTTYWAWLAMRLLSGIGAAGTALAGYILATEPIGESWRGAAGIATQVFFIIGEFALVAIASAFPSWRGTTAAVAVANASLLLLWPLLPESGRWLQVQGRKEEALKVLEVFARRNGSRMPDRPLADIKSEGPRLTLTAALRDWHIARRTLVLAYSWLVICMAYYGISFALSSLGGSLVVSFMVSSIAELPSYIFAGWAIDRYGRHNTMACTMLLGGAACAACAFVPAGGAQIALASIGKFGIAGAFAIASIYTSELFPTLIRSAVLGVVNQAARVGGIIAPFIAMAGAATGSSLIPFLTFGAASLLGGLLIFTLPETLGAPLPDTMDDMGAIASIFTNKTLALRGVRAAAASLFKTRVRLPQQGARASRWSRVGGASAKPLHERTSIWSEDEAPPPAEAGADDYEGELALGHITATITTGEAVKGGGKPLGSGGGGGANGGGSDSGGGAA